ncbi:MAG: methylated-DNA--[Prevotella sp.]|nr:methylated-DNA--[protein]-cysteine S-methyltransferase [Prevotella sp.]
MNDMICIQFYESPCGRLILGSYHDKLCMCDWLMGRHRIATDNRIRDYFVTEMVEKSTDVIEETRHQLDEYFLGKRFGFDIPLIFVGTDFQKQVWNELLNVPYGVTISYAELARRIGKPTAMRAVANANGANAISIIVPCHRVIGSDGSLTGYGGGLPVKRFLLELEQTKSFLV